MKRIMKWLSRLFFACTIGFSFPKITIDFISGNTLLRGLVLTLCGFLGKLATAPFAKPMNCITAMLLWQGMGGRGEFSFLILDDSLQVKNNFILFIYFFKE